MRRGFLIVLLSAGAIFGFASGVHHLRHGYGYGYGHSCWHQCNAGAASSQPCSTP
jgi:hypothetical protein